MSDSATRIGIAVVEHAGQYLIGTRDGSGPLAGYDEFPGGKCHPDEEPDQCALRECSEETGLEVVPVELLLRRKFTYAHGQVDLHFWLCRPNAVEDVAADQCGYHWTSPEKLEDHHFPEANEPIIELLTQRAGSDNQG